MATKDDDDHHHHPNPSNYHTNEVVTSSMENQISPENNPTHYDHLNPYVQTPPVIETRFYPPGFFKKVVAETIATFMLVFVTAGAAAFAAVDENKVSRLGASVAGGLVVTVMIYSVGHISGAHMNPAVTLAFAAVRHFPWKQVPFYVVAQISGGITAGFTLAVVLHPMKRLGTTSPSESEYQALIAEIVMTFSMMFVASAVSTDTKAIGELAGIAVGSAVCITSVFAGPVSGGSMNPARTIGPAVASAYYKGIWIYIVGPVIGTLLGAWSYSFIRFNDNPTQAISSRSFAFKISRMRSNDRQATYRDPLDSA